MKKEEIIAGSINLTIIVLTFVACGYLAIYVTLNFMEYTKEFEASKVIYIKSVQYVCYTIYAIIGICSPFWWLLLSGKISMVIVDSLNLHNKLSR